MKQKVIATMLAMMMTVSMLAGCGNQENKDTKSSVVESTSSSVVEPSPSQEKEDEPKEIVDITVIYSAKLDQPGAVAVIEAMNEYSAEKIGVTASFTYIPSDYASQLSLKLASKENIDLFWTNYTNGLIDFANNGAALDLTDLIPQYEGLENAMPQYVWESSMMNGARYCVPNYKEMGVGFLVHTGKELADTIKSKYGVDFNAIKCSGVHDIAAFEDYLAACVKEGVEYPYAGGVTLSAIAQRDSLYEVLEWPYIMSRETNEVFLAYETPEYKSYIEVMNRWLENGYLKEEQALSDYSKTNVDKTGIYGISPYTTVPCAEGSLAMAYPDRTLYIQPMTENYMNCNSAVGSAWAIPAYSKKADAALKWLELLNTDTVFADMFVFGLEGVNYTRDANNDVIKIANSGWSNDTWKATSVMAVSLLRDEADNKHEEYENFNASVIASSLPGFRVTTSKVAAELSATKAVDSEVQKLYSYGILNASELKNTVDQFVAAGSDVVKAELQSQVDAFLAK